MTEKEKMLSGYLYNSLKDGLPEERMKCKDLCYEFNMCKPSDIESQNEIIRKILGKIKGNFCVTAPFWCDYGYNIEIGNNFYSNHNLIILDPAKVTFGDNVFIAPNCCISTATHAFEETLRNLGFEAALPIKIGNSVWIGAGATILPGITIGDNVIIGAGSIVNKDIPSNVVAAGNPCRVIRSITEEDKKKYPVFND